VIAGWLGERVPERLRRIAAAFAAGYNVDQVAQWTHWDKWFLEQIAELVALEGDLKTHGLPDDPAVLLALKSKGFSDARLAELTGSSAHDIQSRRHQSDIRPVFKRIDTCAAEFASNTAYMYSTYEASAGRSCESNPTDREKVVILGGGPNRIGQGIEFDYCCVHAAYALRDAGYETIMINCNPETVSTDYDTSDRLYFEPLTAEDVIEIIKNEQRNGHVKGVIVQLGGQTPLKISAALEAANIPILGTSPDAIDLAEDRERFQKLVDQWKLKQPSNGIARSLEEAQSIVETIGLPVVIRPSYVLGGRAMEVIHAMADLDRYMKEAVVVSGDNPVLIDGFLNHATEVDVDALADGDDVFIAGIMEHIEEAGIHSGDSACSLPPQNLSQNVLAEIRRQTHDLAKALGVVGLMNVQYAIKDETVYLLEVNPRGSRTVPFVAKATGIAVAKMAARIMAGEKIAALNLEERQLNHVAVKEAVFPFSRFPGVDIFLGPEMKSTGEVMGIGKDFAHAFTKSQLGASVYLPVKGTVFISVKDDDKPEMIEICRDLRDMGFHLVATSGTAKALNDAGIETETVNKVMQGRPHAVDYMVDGKIDLVFNTAHGAAAIRDSFSLRQTALTNSIPYYTTVPEARASIHAIRTIQQDDLDVRPIQSYLKA